MTLLDQKLEELKKNTVVLQYTREITEFDLKLPEWKYLSELYKTKDPIGKVIVSIQNAILTQRRVYFCLTRDHIAKLVKTDPNWKKAGFDNNKYKFLIKVLTDDFKILELVQKGSFKRPDVYKLVDKTLLGFLKIDEPQQLKETIEFADKFKKKEDSDRKTDRISDVVISNKKEVYKNTNLDNDTSKKLDEPTLKKYLSSSTNPKDVAYKLELDFQVSSRIKKNPTKGKDSILRLSPNVDFGVEVLKHLGF